MALIEGHGYGSYIPCTMLRKKKEKTWKGPKLVTNIANVEKMLELFEDNRF
jgi:hypothetical protein